MMNLDEMIEKFNNQEYDFLKPLGSDFSDRAESFFRILARKNRLVEIDPVGRHSGDYQNALLLYFYKVDRFKFYYWVQELLADVEIIDDVAYGIFEPSDLSELFCDNRDASREFIAKILSGELDSGDWYTDDKIDVVNHVIDELNEKNTHDLKAMFIEKLKDKEIEYEDDVILVNTETIDDIFRNNDLLNYILDEELNDLKWGLTNLYANSERNALEEEYYEKCWSELEEYFSVKEKEWERKKSGHYWDKENNMKDRFIEVVKLPILNFDSIIIDFLNDNKKYGDSGTLEFTSNFIKVLTESSFCLRVRFPDYPSSKKVERIINDLFNDYIYV